MLEEPQAAVATSLEDADFAGVEVPGADDPEDELEPDFDPDFDPDDEPEDGSEDFGGEGGFSPFDGEVVDDEGDFSCFFASTYPESR